MSRRRRNRQLHPDILSREIRISRTDASVYFRADKPRGLPATLESDSYLELRGLSEESLRDIKEFSIHLHIDDRKEPGPVLPPSIGAILKVYPVVDAVIGMPGPDFDRVWTLAASGRLHYSRLAFTKPHRGRALIVSASFSKEAEDTT